MKEKTDKLITWVALGIAILASIFAIVFAMNTLNEGMFNIAYWITLLFVVLALVGMVYFFCVRFLKNFKENPAKARRTLIVLGIAIVVILISYLCASGTDVPMAMLDKNGVTTGTSKWIGAGAIMVYILVIAAIIAIIYVECAKMFKK
ncbi:MAG: hypothetical protein IJ764_01550 [Bacteroidales bacterium]|nr:hypothetical protein [Bacteroidales bacterium]